MSTKLCTECSYPAPGFHEQTCSVFLRERAEANVRWLAQQEEKASSYSNASEAMAALENDIDRRATGYAHITRFEQSGNELFLTLSNGTKLVIQVLRVDTPKGSKR